MRKSRIISEEYIAEFPGRIVVFNENYDYDGTQRWYNAEPWRVQQAGAHKSLSFETHSEAIRIAQMEAANARVS